VIPKDLHVGYVPCSSDLTHPADRRRFVNYAQRRGLNLAIADPSEKYDLVILSERADLSIWCDYGKGKLVYDLIDSYLAIPRTSFMGNLRGMAKFITRQSRYLQLNHWQAIERMCRRADAVVCSTEEQYRDIVKFCNDVHIILDVHSMFTQVSKLDYTASTPFKLVWEGLPHTLDSLGVISKVLRRFQSQRQVELHVITDLEYWRYLGRYVKGYTQDLLDRVFPGAILHEWHERKFAQMITHCDLAIIPIDLNDPFAAGKPENKLLLLWRLGMPVIVSATPAYLRAMNSAGLEMACTDDRQWEEMLMKCSEDEALRKLGGESGRQCAEMQYGEDSILLGWDRVMESLWE